MLAADVLAVKSNSGGGVSGCLAASSAAAAGLITSLRRLCALRGACQGSMETGDENASHMNSKRPKVDPPAAAAAAAAPARNMALVDGFMAEQNAIATAEIATAHSYPAVCIGGTFSVRLIGGQR